jgi:hypothetical protein
MSRAVALAIVLLLTLNPGQASGANPEGDRLHFKLVAGSVIVLPALVNGRGPYDFVFDTGSETTLIDADLARELGIAPVDRMRLESSNGTSVLARAFVEISLGPARVLNSEVLMGSMQALRSVGPSIRGIIGQSFLRHFDYILDNVHSAIDLMIDKGELTMRGVRLDLRRTHALPIVTAKLKDSSHIDLVLDSGASNLTLYRRSHQAATPFLSTASKSELRSSLWIKQVVTGLIPNLEVAGHRFGNLQTALVNVHSTGEVDGLLPTNLFSRIYFNNSAAYVVLERER